MFVWIFLLVFVLLAFPLWWLYRSFNKKAENIVDELKRQFIEEVTPIIKDFNFITDRNLTLLEEKIAEVRKLVAAEKKEGENTEKREVKESLSSTPEWERVSAYVIDPSLKQKNKDEEELLSPSEENQIENEDERTALNKLLMNISSEKEQEVLQSFDHKHSLALIAYSTDLDEEIVEAILYKHQKK